MNDHLRDLVGPDDDVRLVAALERLATGLSQPPDEVTAARHRRAIRAAVARSSGPVGLGRGVAAAAGLAVLVAGFATSPRLEIAPAVTDTPPEVDGPAERVPDAAWDRLPELLTPPTPTTPDATRPEADETRQDAEASRFGRETAEEASDDRSEVGRETAEEAGPPDEATRPEQTPGDDARDATPGADQPGTPPITEREDSGTVREADDAGSERADDAQDGHGTSPPSDPGR